jgi:hypothetical protein
MSIVGEAVHFSAHRVEAMIASSGAVNILDRILSA